MKGPKHDAPNTVYLIKDAAGAVIYVGCTFDLERRTRDHRRALYADRISSVEVDSVHPNWMDAHSREVDLIWDLSPELNVRHKFEGEARELQLAWMAELTALMAERGPVMTSNPIRLFRSPLTGRVYATRAYRVYPDGGVKVTGQKFDVTDEVLALAAEITKELGPLGAGGSAAQGEASGQATIPPITAAASPTRQQPGLTPPRHTPEPSGAPTSAPAVASFPTT